MFSYQEMSRRVANLRQKMLADNIDCVIATSYVGSYYLSGVPIHWFGRPLATVIPLEGEAVLIESVIEIEHSRAQSWITDIRPYWDYNIEPSYEHPISPLESMVRLLGGFLEDRGLTNGRIGIEGADLPLAHYEALRTALPNATFVSISRMLAELRMVLSDEELRLVRAADEIADIGQQALIETIRVGKSAYETEMPIKDQMVTTIMDRYPEMPFHIHVGCGLGSGDKAAGHSEWTTWNKADVIRPGQLLETIVDVWLWGYWGNVERAISVGEPDEAMRKAFDVMVEANEAAIDVVRPGIRLSEVDQATKAVFTKHGFDTRTGSGCGRGITSYEGNARELLMDLRLYSDVVLQQGMAFSIEPDLRVPGMGTFRHCNTVIVTEDGCEVDSTLPRGVIWV